MIQIKTDEEIEVMRKSAKLAAEVLIMIEPYVKPGVTTNRLDEICHDFIISHDAIPSPLNYRGFQKAFVLLLMMKFAMVFLLIGNSVMAML